jgi:exonuclease VII small subunit
MLKLNKLITKLESKIQKLDKVEPDKLKKYYDEGQQILTDCDTVISEYNLKIEDADKFIDIQKYETMTITNIVSRLEELNGILNDDELDIDIAMKLYMESKVLEQMYHTQIQSLETVVEHI